MRKKPKLPLGPDPRRVLSDFLTRLDHSLPHRIQAYLVGGGGLVLAFGIPRFTADLDFLESSDSRQLKRTFETLRKKFEDLPFEIQLVPSEWFPLPGDYEENAMLLREPPLKKLKIKVLKTEDLLLAKMARGSSKDLEDIRWLVQNVPIDPQGLLERYRQGRANVATSVARLDRTFLYLMQDLFGKHLSQKDLQKGPGE